MMSNISGTSVLYSLIKDSWRRIMACLKWQASNREINALTFGRLNVWYLRLSTDVFQWELLQHAVLYQSWAQYNFLGSRHATTRLHVIGLPRCAAIFRPLKYGNVISTFFKSYCRVIAKDFASAQLCNSTVHGYCLKAKVRLARSRLLLLL